MNRARAHVCAIFFFTGETKYRKYDGDYRGRGLQQNKSDNGSAKSNRMILRDKEERSRHMRLKVINLSLIEAKALIVPRRSIERETNKNLREKKEEARESTE